MSFKRLAGIARPVVYDWAMPGTVEFTKSL
jgi:hypothetical protein